ncbi:MAG: nitronate monooxygenase [Halieaceae bacterium]|nr:nitronate monooxygenase [Halieaceae bacterium]
MKSRLLADLCLPLIVAPMFLVSGPDLVKASCLSGVVGSFPFPNALDISTLDAWLDGIDSELKGVASAAPYAVNITTHRTYDRLEDEIALIKNHKPKFVITALGGPEPIIDIVHGYGGMVIADVNSLEYARKAVKKGVDGLALIAAGAGGHTGQIAGLSFVGEVREFFDGLTILAGGISTGTAMRAAQVAGADLCYMGTRFIATAESSASVEYKQMIVEASFEDLILTDQITGAKAYYLRKSLQKMGLDPDNLEGGGRIDLSDLQNQIKAWRDVWSAGHGVGATKQIQPLAEIVSQLLCEYDAAISGP